MARVIPLVVVLVSLAGCGGSSSSTGSATTSGGPGTVDTSTIEQQIESQLSGPTVTITSVSCPSDVQKKKGGTFDCTAQIKGGGTATVVVTQVNGINRYTYAFKPGTLKIPGSAVEPVVQQSLQKEGVNVTGVTCPSTIIVKTDSPVTCTATTQSGAQIDVTFTLSSTGEVNPSSVQSG